MHLQQQLELLLCGVGYAAGIARGRGGGWCKGTPFSDLDEPGGTNGVVGGGGASPSIGWILSL